MELGNGGGRGSDTGPLSVGDSCDDANPPTPPGGDCDVPPNGTFLTKNAGDPILLSTVMPGAVVGTRSRSGGDEDLAFPGDFRRISCSGDGAGFPGTDELPGLFVIA